MIYCLACPSSFQPERSYAASVVFRHFLGCALEVTFQSRTDWHLSIPERSGHLVMPDSFFSTAGQAWLRPGSMPGSPLPRWDAARDLPDARLTEPTLPVIAGSPYQGRAWFVRRGADDWYLGLDACGAIFFMLSQYEELVVTERDDHGRFPAGRSLASSEDFLERPIVDEYVEALFCAMRRVWPRLTTPRARGRVVPTCDVDAPYDTRARSLRALVRSTSADVLRRRNPGRAARRISNAWIHRNDPSRDVNNTFAWMMDTCESRGVSLVFFFIAGRSGGAIDGSYSLSEPFVRDLLGSIHTRGHEIGMHGSYNTLRDPDQLARERSTLSQACGEAGVEAEVRGNRQHYLRWDSALTPASLERAGFTYDATGSYADRAGFRFGTARSFPAWDWDQGRMLRLMERPLIMMESTVIAKRYMGLGYSSRSLEYMIRLRERALRYGGDFVFLWHNTHLSRPEDREFFTSLLIPR